MICFYIKVRGVQCLVFVQIAFQKCTTSFYFESGEIGRKDNCQFTALISTKRFRMFPHFYAAIFTIKTCFYETSIESTKANTTIQNTNRLIKELQILTVNNGSICEKEVYIWIKRVAQFSLVIYYMLSKMFEIILIMTLFETIIY